MLLGIELASYNADSNVFQPFLKSLPNSLLNSSLNLLLNSFNMQSFLEM